MTGLRPIAEASIDESKKLMDVLSFEAGGQAYGLPADEVENVMALPEARLRLGTERLANAVDLGALLDPDDLGRGGAEDPDAGVLSECRVILGRGSDLAAIVRGRVMLSRVFRTQLLPLPSLISDTAADRGIVGIAVSERSALFLLVSLLPFGGLAVPL